MRLLKIGLVMLVMLGVFAVLHYALPQRDVVRIVNTDIRRMDFGWNAMFYAAADSGADATGANRDIRFIEAVDPDGDPMVYRNEDTGWGYPFYFKFDAADLQAEAADLTSTRDTAIWVAVTHYGWRSRLLSAFPNATSITRVEGPEVRFLPWLPITILVALAVAALAIYRLVAIIWRTRIRPIFSRGDDA